MAAKHFPYLAYNWITGIGAVLASISFFAIAVLLILSDFAGMGNPYIGVLIYVFLPAIMVLGLLLIPFGMWRRARKLRRDKVEELPPWPRIDLNVKTVRNGAFVFVAGTVFVTLLSTVAMYEGYHWTDSVGFCGKLCHTVMEPEYVSHEISPHAVVACTTCHVGPGVGWYEKSKIRGLDRLYQVLASTYPRPIPTPISDLKPTEIECHRCHWPENFFGGRRWVFHNYMYDQKNTRWRVDMIIHTGGGDPSIGETGGIHWYMNIGYKIEYIARDPQRQEIPWVRATNKKTGKVTVYQDESNPLSQEEMAGREPACGWPQIMDCIDCHNDSTHILRPPDDAVNMALFLNEIDADLPDIKKVAVSAMTWSYESRQAAMSGIARAIGQHYRDQHRELYEKKRAEIDAAVQATQKRYSQNIFPAMNARWKAYPNNLGHFYAPGCFRCHLGRHRSKTGETIPHDCNTCHDIRFQGSGKLAETQESLVGLAFKHPVDIGGLWDLMTCSTCHTGAVVGEGEGRIIKPQTPKPKSQIPSPKSPIPRPLTLPALSAAEKAKVGQLYQQQCAECHGADGRSNAAMRTAMPQMPDFTDPKWQAAHTTAEMEQAVLDGKGKMPGFQGKLGGIPVAKFVVYVRQFAQGKAKQAAGPASGCPDH
jgi:mono/diheme cytochrome c family protein